MTTKHPRRGFALVLVLIVIVLLASLTAVVYRTTASTLRMETIKTIQTDRDGSLHAIARGIALLETGTPPTDPFIGAAIIQTVRGPRSFTVTFTSHGPDGWSLYAAPTASDENPPPLPQTFAP